MANGYNGAAGENVSLPILAYDSYGTYLSLSSTATLEVWAPMFEYLTTP